MTRPSGPQLLSRVVLPGEAVIGAAHLRDALRVSRQVLHLWRARHGFPRGHREGHDSLTLTDDVVDWLRARGVIVVRTAPQPLAQPPRPPEPPQPPPLPSLSL